MRWYLCDKVLRQAQGNIMPPVIPRAVLHIIARQEEGRHADCGTQHRESDQRVHNGQNARFIRSKRLQARIAVSSPCMMCRSPRRQSTTQTHTHTHPTTTTRCGHATHLRLGKRPHCCAFQRCLLMHLIPVVTAGQPPAGDGLFLGIPQHHRSQQLVRLAHHRT